MPALRSRAPVLAALALVTACASAGDRLNEGIALQSQGRPFFDPNVLAGQVGRIEEELTEDLAVAIAAGTYDALLSGVR